MGDRALNFSLAHTDASPGYAEALAGLQQRLTRARQLAEIQQDGINLAPHVLRPPLPERPASSTLDFRPS